MNTIPYFPGCSLKDTAASFESSAQFVMEKLGLQLQELERWNCCGTVSSLTTDDLMHHLASVRNLVRVQDLEQTELVALCSMCYNTLSRTAQRINADAEERDKINQFMDRESDYQGAVVVRHLLQVLRDRIGWQALEQATPHSLEGLNVACYYGCTLLRPKEAAIDNVEKPTIMSEAMAAAGAMPVHFPFAGECCGTYQVVDRRDLSIERSFRVIQSAAREGANVIATACPLCQHNLKEAQRELAGASELADIEIVYFTELLAAAMGMDSQKLPEGLSARMQQVAEAQTG
ncbi:CoB--CoM heterodisulfide reductase iron-sulfur subunit B family protein [Candidatus Bipolaricaulota bacterium]|nr:CoB--CoM heterodisulfide reductase iron-sulfur subunit B family protein [Candidatus Bipolaricaulota bacterium]